MRFLVFLFLITTAGAAPAPQALGLPKSDEQKVVGPKPYIDREGGFELVLDDGWRPEVLVDNTGKRIVEIILRDRSVATLKIKKEKPLDRKPEDLDDVTALIESEIENDLRFRPEYAYVNRERFVINQVGVGKMLQCTYRKAGKLMLARQYYIQTAPDTIWVLRFVGEKRLFETQRSQSDNLARTFKPIP